MAGESQTTAAWRGPLQPLPGPPGKRADLTDFDGTLAPIVQDADAAALPDGAREVLPRLIERYAMVGAISGRRAADVRERMGLDGLAYAGNHGLELMMPGESEPKADPSLDGREGDAAAFLAAVDAARLEAAGLRLEDKGPIQALHWRGAPDETQAEAAARGLGVEAGRGRVGTPLGRKGVGVRAGGGGGEGGPGGPLLPEGGGGPGGSA